jgi:hypothetical protein
MKTLPVMLTLIFSLVAGNLGFSTSTPKSGYSPVLQTNSSQFSSSLKNPFLQMDVQAVMKAITASTIFIPPGNRISTFTQLNLYPNIETIGIVVSGANLPKKADLMYRQSSETVWHSGHSLIRIDDGRLVGSLFELAPSTSYSVRVLDGITEISGSTTTQSNELQFIPSVILHVNDDAPAGGDGTVAAPFQTIQDGVNHAGPGTQVLVADGLYPEKVSFPASGAPGNWIQVKAEGSGAILDGSETLSGSVWKQEEGMKNVWFVRIGRQIGYLARDNKRFYMYDDKSGLLQSRGHNNVPMNEGWFIEPDTSKLYVRSLNDPSSHTWQAPYLNIAFNVDGRDWLWIEGFEIRYYGAVDGCGVCMKNASHVVIRKNKIHNLHKGIFIFWTGGEDQGNDTRIEYNEIYDPAVSEWPWNAVKGTSMEGTAIIVRGHIGAIVRGNQVHHFFNGIYTGSSAALENSALAFDADIYNNHIHHIMDDALEPEGACINQRFRNNTVDTALVGISLAPITQGPTWVLRNTFNNYTGKAVKWDRNSDGVVLIYHNTSWTNTQISNGMDLISPVHNAVMRNNIFQTNGYAFQEVLTGSTGHDWNHDNWYTTRGLDSSHFKWENVAYNTIAQLCGATGLECNGYEDFPGLSNPGGGDFTLLQASPNIDRGVVIPGINDNFSGNAPDVGAIEFVIPSPPTALSIIRSNPNPTNAAIVNFTVTFSEPVTGVDGLAPFNDFALITDPAIVGAYITSVSMVSGTTYTVEVNTGLGKGSIGLNLVDDDSIVDTTGNPLGGAGTGNGSFITGEIYIVEKGSPTVTGIVRIDPNPTAADSVHFTVNFNQEVSGVDAGDFIPNTTGSVSAASVAEVIGSGNVYTVTVNIAAGEGTLRLDILDDDSIVDVMANRLGGDGTGNGNFTAGDVYIIDKIAPAIISILRAEANPTVADSVRFNVTFSEAVNGVDTSDFMLTTTDGLSGASVLGLNGSANTYTITVATGSGNGTLRLDLIDNDSIIDFANHPMGGPGAGNGSYTMGEIYTVNKFAVNTLSTAYRSNGTNDGWILESSENSNKGGTKNSNATTFNIGDDGRDRMYRAILHFPTNSLPDNAVVTQVILMIKKKSIVGTDPFITHQNISMDIRKGAFGNFNIFSFWSLQPSDFQAPADMNSVGLIQNNPVSGWYWAMLDNKAFSYINLVGVTQIRLGFQLDDNDDLGEDSVRFYSGDSPEQTDRPHLQIDYYVPK